MSEADAEATELDPSNGHPERRRHGDDEQPAPAPEPIRTGSARVDEVLRAVEELEDRPIEEHVGVFESAQVELRRALDEPGEPDGADGHNGHP